ncbi:unnamed protein product [Closterium sp. NIES-65]|nr:unnamed protein product [Closterium sp. NIES-65]
MARLLSRVPERLGEMLLPLMQAMAAIQRHQFTDAFGEMLQAANSSHSHVSPPCLPPPCARQSVSTGAAQLGGHVGAAPAARGGARPARAGGEGEQADMEQRAAGKSPDKLKAAASFLMKVFGAIAGKGPKKVGSLYVACQLFKIYFKVSLSLLPPHSLSHPAPHFACTLGTLNLSKSIIRVIDSSKGFDDYPARDQVLPPPLSPSSSHACLPVPVPPVCLFVLLVTSTSSLTLILSCLLACPGAACLPLLPPGVCTSTSSLTLILSCLLACPGAACLPLLPPGVTYKYYTGRLDVFNDAFLLVCARTCHAPFNRSRTCHLILLPPLASMRPLALPIHTHALRLSLGHLPSPELLRNHHLQEVLPYPPPLALRSLTARYFLLCSLCCCSFRPPLPSAHPCACPPHPFSFPVIHVLQRAKDPARAHQVRLEVVVRALAGRGVAVDVDELEGLVATLIALGFVKGYLSHKSKVVVLSKQDPFPRLTGRVLL